MISKVFTATELVGLQRKTWDVLAESPAHARRVLAHYFEETHASQIDLEDVLIRMAPGRWDIQPDSPERLLIEGELYHPGAYVGVVDGSHVAWYEPTEDEDQEPEENPHQKGGKPVVYYQGDRSPELYGGSWYWQDPDDHDLIWVVALSNNEKELGLEYWQDAHHKYQVTERAVYLSSISEGDERGIRSSMDYDGPKDVHFALVAAQYGCGDPEYFSGNNYHKLLREHGITRSMLAKAWS